VAVLTAGCQEARTGVASISSRLLVSPSATTQTMLSRQKAAMTVAMLMVPTPALTDEGRRFLAEYDPVVEELEQRMLGDLDEEERAALRTSLDACRRALGTPSAQVR
jgi:hypothetical protein